MCNCRYHKSHESLQQSGQKTLESSLPRRRLVSQDETKDEGEIKMDTLAVPGKDKKYEINFHYTARILLFYIIKTFLRTEVRGDFNIHGTKKF